MIVGFRKQAPLVLDRSALHCCLCYDDQSSIGQGGATSLVRRRSNPIRSASFISISPKCELKKEGL